jgi:TonB family protein
MRLWLVFLCGLILLHCSSTPSRHPEAGFYAPKQPKFLIEMDDDGRKDGKEVWWYPNGQMKYESANRAGFRDGRFTAWFQDGVKWYEGYEYHGKPESTLTYWYPNGKIKSQALFRDGIQLERKDWDETGRSLAPRTAWVGAPDAAVDEESEETARLRQTSLKMWAIRVRQTVESYWRPGKQFEKEAPHKAVAKIQVDRQGRILAVTWAEKSGSPAFNSQAQQTFKKIKRMPAFPPQIKDETLDVQYEFVTQGKSGPRKKLEAFDPAAEPPTE